MPKRPAVLWFFTSLLVGTILVGPVHADSATALFTERVGGGPLPGASATLVLNADGTVSATVTSLSSLPLIGFGLDSGFQFVSYDFSAPNVTSSGWGTSFGGFATGWTQSIGTASMSWLIGSRGSFTSVLDLLHGNGSPFDAFAFVSDPRDGFTEYAADFTPVAVPELEISALLLAGLGVVGAVARRRVSRG